MRITKARYTQDGVTKKTSKWYVELRDHHGLVRRIPAAKDRSVSESLGVLVERLVDCKRGAVPIPLELAVRVRALPTTTLRRLVLIGLAPAEDLESARGIEDLLVEWRSVLLGRGASTKHASQTVMRVRRLLIDRMKLRHWAALRPGALEAELARVRAEQSLSAETRNKLLAHVRQFARWMVETGRAERDPLVVVRPLRASAERTIRRRALNIEECQRLIAAARGGERAFGMSGWDRAMLYRLALETGLRANEIRSLQVTSFNLDARPPTATVLAASSKRRREDKVLLRDSLATELQHYLAQRGGESAPAIPIPPAGRTADILRVDLAVAGIAEETHAGRVDFHALRHTFCSLLDQGGVSAGTSQKLARHSTVTLTLDRYTHASDAMMADALEHALPELAANLAVLVPTNDNECAQMNTIGEAWKAVCGSGGGTRTHDTRLMKPGGSSPGLDGGKMAQVLCHQGFGGWRQLLVRGELRTNPADLAGLLAVLRQFSGVARLVARWPELTPQARKRVLRAGRLP